MVLSWVYDIAFRGRSAYIVLKGLTYRCVMYSVEKISELISNAVTSLYRDGKEPALLVLGQYDYLLLSQFYRNTPLFSHSSENEAFMGLTIFEIDKPNYVNVLTGQQAQLAYKLVATKNDLKYYRCKPPATDTLSLIQTNYTIRDIHNDLIKLMDAFPPSLIKKSHPLLPTVLCGTHAVICSSQGTHAQTHS